MPSQDSEAADVQTGGVRTVASASLATSRYPIAPNLIGNAGIIEARLAPPSYSTFAILHIRSGTTLFCPAPKQSLFCGNPLGQPHCRMSKIYSLLPRLTVHRQFMREILSAGYTLPCP